MFNLFKNFLILIFFFKDSSLVMSVEKILIDFQKYEEKLLEENCCIDQNQNFNQAYKKTIEKLDEGILNITDIQFPVEYKNYNLDRWIIRINPKKYKSNPFILKEGFFFFNRFYRKVYPFAENIKLDANGLWIYLNFSTDKNRYKIEPYYNFYPYNKNGDRIQDQNGILHNLNSERDIERIIMKVGYFGSMNDSTFLAVNLKNSKDEIITIPLGAIFFKPYGKSLFYESYQNQQFSNPFDIKLVTIPNIYYQVYYSPNGEKYYWIKFFNGKPIYREMILEWRNSNFLPAKNLLFLNDFFFIQKQKQKGSIRLIPYFMFDSIEIYKSEKFIKSHFYHLVIKSIEVVYRKYLNNIEEEDFYIDKNNWDFIRKKAKKQKQKIDKVNNNRTISLIKYAYDKGIRNVDFFKEYIYLK